MRADKRYQDSRANPCRTRLDNTIAAVAQDLGKDKDGVSPGKSSGSFASTHGSATAGRSPHMSTPQSVPKARPKAERLQAKEDSEDDEHAGNKNTECSHVACSTKVTINPKPDRSWTMHGVMYLPSSCREAHPSVLAERLHARTNCEENLGRLAVNRNIECSYVACSAMVIMYQECF